MNFIKLLTNIKQNRIIKYSTVMEGSYIVNTEYGKVRGALQASLVDGSYIRFLGIPYAAKPIGNLRFKVWCLSVHQLKSFTLTFLL